MSVRDPRVAGCDTWDMWDSADFAAHPSLWGGSQHSNPTLLFELGGLPGIQATWDTVELACDGGYLGLALC
eukprot:3564257-Amphidinium_carterae.1